MFGDRAAGHRARARDRGVDPRRDRVPAGQHQLEHHGAGGASCSAPACAATSRTWASRFCRALNIPARIVVGYVWFDEPPQDFHAMFEAWLDGRWVLFDPTGMAPVDRLVRIGTGRDAKDVAFATMFGQLRDDAQGDDGAGARPAAAHDVRRRRAPSAARWTAGWLSCGRCRASGGRAQRTVARWSRSRLRSDTTSASVLVRRIRYRACAAAPARRCAAPWPAVTDLHRLRHALHDARVDLHQLAAGLRSIWMRQVFSKVYMKEGVGDGAAHGQQAVVAQHQEVGLSPRSAAAAASRRRAAPRLRSRGRRARRARRSLLRDRQHAALLRADARRRRGCGCAARTAHRRAPRGSRCGW